MVPWWTRLPWILWRLVPSKWRYRLARRLFLQNPGTCRFDLSSWAEDPGRYNSLADALRSECALRERPVSECWLCPAMREDMGR